ncbi:uncharacterized oxidoreductase At4g09670-like [Andrographis paniculata]|uniref:uncharacterized oxidoreductase At4g09670-like n=1 Tax=Andrographis paniculata TaxID=175694 RepID=UPI0021E8AA6E|nr:uncharacterized oxidoreductase At4g09670-like [Andrographis paniculata]
MAAPPINIGIVGCADISRKISRAITLSPNSTICAVGSRSAEKAARFAADNGLPDSTKIHPSYDAVLDDPDVDAVYMPLPTGLHIKWAVAAARRKKHLLLEKPLGLNVREVDTILEACESNGVQIMDGTMWMHNPRTTKMKEFLSDPSEFGNLKSVHSCFTFAADEDYLKNNIRVKPDLDGLGALGDAGWYCIRSILWAVDFDLPKTVLALRGAVFNAAGVILSCSAALSWEDGKVATFHCSFLANLTMDMTVIGTKGTLHLHDFIIPFEEAKASFSASVEPEFNDLVTGWARGPRVVTVATELPQEALMVREFCRLVQRIKYEGGRPEKKWPSISRKTHLILDAVKASIESGYQTVHVAG